MRRVYRITFLNAPILSEGYKPFLADGEKQNERDLVQKNLHAISESVQNCEEKLNISPLL